MENFEINPDNSEAEVQIQNTIYTCLDSFKDFVFSAGAGAGKTYALIESLKYAIKNYGSPFAIKKQKIACITYTNVAANEIKHRLGQTELISVSTIHELLWGLIKSYQKELLEIHKEHLKSEIARINFDLYENEEEVKSYKEFRSLEPMMADFLTNYLKQNKELFYSVYDKPSKEFKASFLELLEKTPKILNNVASFKSYASSIYRVENYNECLELMSQNNPKYVSVRYEPKFNNDVLHRMIFSHDTLLNYSKKLILSREVFKQVCVDSFPIVFVDEFQDTNSIVVEILNELSVFAKKTKKKFVVGYFGDKVQNIYDDGVGENISTIHQELQVITKEFNRRSRNEVINVINKIRNDSISQVSIFSSNTGGNVSFFCSASDNADRRAIIDNFIVKHVSEWEISGLNKLHCLFLTNKLVATMSGFLDFYLWFSGTSFYKKNYESLNTELLSKDPHKLGSVPEMILSLIEFHSIISNDKSPLTDVFPDKILKKMEFKEVKRVLTRLRSLKNDTFLGFLHSLFSMYSEGDVSLNSVIEDSISLEDFSLNGLMDYIKLHLFQNSTDDDETIRKTIHSLFNLNSDQFYHWFCFVKDIQVSNVVFHTYHGTKGLEFDNVVIIMENDFGMQNRNMFSNYFKNVLSIDEDMSSNEKFIKTRNLLYVSCSRARKNLSILYLDNVTEFKEGIEKIFGEVRFFPETQLG